MHERRHSPRYPLSGRVQLSVLGAASHAAEMEDISALGVGLLVSHATATVLAQGGSVLMPGDRIQVEWGAEQQTGSSDALNVICRVRHSRRLSFDTYHVGALFIDPDPFQQMQIAALLTTAQALVKG